MALTGAGAWILVMMEQDVQRTVSGLETLYRFSPLWMFAFIGAVTLVLCACLLIRIRLLGRIGKFLTAILLLTIVLLPPYALNSSLRVNDAGFVAQSGFWFEPDVFDVRYDDIEGMDIRSGARKTARTRDKILVLHCLHRSGTVQEMDVNLLVTAAKHQIKSACDQRGIRFRNHSQDPEWDFLNEAANTDSLGN